MFGFRKDGSPSYTHDVQGLMEATANWLRLESVTIVAVPDRERIELRDAVKTREHITFGCSYKRW